VTDASRAGSGAQGTRDRTHDPAATVTSSPEPPLALNGGTAVNADGTPVPNNARDGTTPYVPETPMSSFQTTIGAARPFEVVSRSFDRIQGNTAQRDVRGLTICPMRLPPLRPLPHIVIPGTPREGRRESALPVQKQAAGARAAWFRSFRFPSCDHDARATLGRQRRTRRPGQKEPGSADRHRGSEQYPPWPNA
jgi:hypothetical protein